MSRKIEFRVRTWDIMFYQGDQYLASFLRRSIWLITWWHQHESRLDNNISYYLMQYTWLKDKNWKKIFDKDILLDYNWERHLLIWEEHSSPFSCIEYYNYWEDFEIIWNEYENYDLICKENNNER